MTKTAIFSMLLFITAQCSAESVCFKARQGDNILKEYGHCDERATPASTFKIAISLMGYDQGILVDSDTPLIGYDATKYPEAIEFAAWATANSPASWIKHSCLWFSREITGQLGLSSFKQYVDHFHYGNKDISGDIGSDNGLTHSWISSSLAISPNEQLSFLSHIIDRDYTLSDNAYQYTIVNLHHTDIDNHRLFGKTGMGYQTNEDGSIDRTRQIGWFVGWLETDGLPIIFAHLVEREPVEGEYASFVARDEAIEILKSLSS